MSAAPERGAANGGDRSMPGRFRRSEYFVHRHIAGEHLLIALRRDQAAPMFTLSETSAALWERLEQWVSPESLVAYLVQHYEVDRLEAESDVKDFLESLRALGAVEVKET